MFVVAVEDVSWSMNLLFQPLWLQLDNIGNRSLHFSGPWRQGREAGRPSLKTEGAAEAIDTLHLRVMDHADGPLNDLDIIIRVAQARSRTFVDMLTSLTLLKAHYMHRHINPHRWEITRITKLKQMTSQFKHQFIVARLEYRGEDGVHIIRYLRLDRIMGKRSNSLGLHISGALNHAHVFLADDPGTNVANETLMALAPDEGAAGHLSLPGILVLGHQIHNVAPDYGALSTNYYWFADAMVQALQRSNWLVIQGQQPEGSSRRNRLVNRILHKSVPTEEQMNRIVTDFIHGQERFFNFRDAAV